MFGEYIRRAGTPAYGPTHRQQASTDTPDGLVLSYLLILAVEELLDHANRATMRDERLHPVSRQIAKVHVLEEARHVSFAKTYVSELWPTLDAAEQTIVTSTAGPLVAAVVQLNLDKRVYEVLGIDNGLADVKANPNYRANVINGVAKLTGFLSDIGILDDDHRDEWVTLGLINS